MAGSNNPIDKLKDAALDALKDPKGAAAKAVEQAKGTAAIGRMVVGQVGRVAFSRAGELAGEVLHRRPPERTPVA
ncbi:MAG: hypothetical protein HOQ45_04725, partial [Nocardioidaceae bacterium]|nr:hypothetical protein [Nocardioidaceae bacterium]